ncbi:MAG: PilZ domain-containing protein [Psychrobium sp.]|nr:PilZ domain-containing protein [Psychrobium sp.]
MSVEQHFFSIEHDFEVHATPMPLDSVLPSEDDFLRQMPASFRLASQLNELESSALRPLRQLGDSAHELASFLNVQSKKIDLIMSYILTLSDDHQYRLRGTSFGGSNLTYISPDPLIVDQLITLKIFIKDSNCAIYCLARVIASTSADDAFIIEAKYEMINDEDLELLVRTSLHVQSAQLKERAQQRKDQQSLDS